MNLKEYLTTLSKENLISLLMDLADINKEVRIYLTEKQNALPVLSEQNKPILPVADTLFNSTPAINRHSTPQQKIDLFKFFFLADKMFLHFAGSILSLIKAVILQSAVINGFQGNVT